MENKTGAKGQACTRGASWNAAAAAFLHGRADKVIGLARASGADHRSEIEHMHDYRLHVASSNMGPMKAQMGTGGAPKPVAIASWEPTQHKARPPGCRPRKLRNSGPNSEIDFACSNATN